MSERMQMYPGLRERPDAYISDWARELGQQGLNSREALDLVKDKLAFDSHMRQQGLEKSLPRLVGYVSGGHPQLHLPIDSFPQGVVIKPRFGRRGTGVRLVHSEDEIQSTLADTDEAIIQERVDNHPYSKQIFPDSLNTIRVLTLRDPTTRTPFVGAATHRFGTSATGWIDGHAAGGAIANVDIQDGTMSALVVRSGRGRARVTDHPETRRRVAGLIVPHWQEAKALAIKAMDMLPPSVQIGWDIAITPTGPLIIEANGHPELAFMQAHGPFQFPPTRSFFEYHGMLR